MSKAVYFNCSNFFYVNCILGCKLYPFVYTFQHKSQSELYMKNLFTSILLIKHSCCSYYQPPFPMTSIYFQDYTNFQIVFIDLSLFFRSHHVTILKQVMILACFMDLRSISYKWKITKKVLVVGKSRRIHVLGKFHV